jgi:hypothetical protein
MISFLGLATPGMVAFFRPRAVSIGPASATGVAVAGGAAAMRVVGAVSGKEGVAVVTDFQCYFGGHFCLMLYVICNFFGFV